MLRLPIIAAAAALSASSTSAQNAVAMPSADIEWSFELEADGQSEVHFFREGMRAGLDASDAPAVIGALVAAVGAPAGGETAFSLQREAGVLSCTGRVTGPGAAEGACSFDPDERFAQALAERNIAADDPDDLLTLALVDAHLASVDGLAHLGLRAGDSGELISLSALNVTPQFARGLREAGLDIDTIDDLVAARGVDVSPEWLSAMAEAGYPGLSAEQAIEMRATGVTPEYARKMARVLSATAGND